MQIDQRLAAREPAEQLAQRLERPPPETERIGAPELLRRGAASAMARTCSSTGNTRVNAATSGGSRLLDVLAWNRREIAAQIVDHPVERLVRHRLVLVAAAGEHDDIVARGDLARESAGPARSCRCLTGRRPTRPPRPRS